MFSLSLDPTVILTIIAYIFGIVILYYLILSLIIPIRTLANFLGRVFIGGIFLFIVNIIIGYLGMRVAINPMTALISGYLGVPGVGLLLALKYIVL